MISHRVIETSCAGKLQHKDKAAAKQSIRSLQKSGRGQKSQYNAYYCIFCGFWHVGHNRNSFRVPPPPPVMDMAR